ncbi:hypothetical protein Hanom_Chr10g00943101 [Helianthus anomalus]
MLSTISFTWQECWSTRKVLITIRKRAHSTARTTTFPFSNQCGLRIIRFRRRFHVSRFKPMGGTRCFRWGRCTGPTSRSSAKLLTRRLNIGPIYGLICHLPK